MSVSWSNVFAQRTSRMKASDIRELLTARMTGMGIPASPDEVLITNGSQQGLDLVGKIFLNPGDAVCLENPSYMGAIQAFDSYQAEYVIVPMDDDGMRSD